jgi:hypothetical protein
MWMKYFWKSAEALRFAVEVGGEVSLCGNGRWKVEWKPA